MNPLNELLQFFDIKERPEHQVLERHEDLIIIRCYDEVMEVSCGSFTSDVSVVTFDYSVYIDDNKTAFRKFKKEYFEAQAKVTAMKRAELEKLITPPKLTRAEEMQEAFVASARQSAKTSLYFERYMNDLLMEAKNMGKVTYQYPHPLAQELRGLHCDSFKLYYSDPLRASSLSDSDRIAMGRSRVELPKQALPVLPNNGHYRPGK